MYAVVIFLTVSKYPCAWMNSTSYNEKYKEKGGAREVSCDGSGKRLLQAALEKHRRNQEEGEATTRFSKD